MDAVADASETPLNFAVSKLPIHEVIRLYSPVNPMGAKAINPARDDGDFGSFNVHLYIRRGTVFGDGIPVA